jgi:hypothetical protein
MLLALMRSLGLSLTPFIKFIDWVSYNDIGARGESRGDLEKTREVQSCYWVHRGKGVQFLEMPSFDLSQADTELFRRERKKNPSDTDLLCLIANKIQE